MKGAVLSTARWARWSKGEVGVKGLWKGGPGAGEVSAALELIDKLENYSSANLKVQQSDFCKL